MATIEDKMKKQKQRESVHKKICDDYLSLRSQYPEAAPYSIFETLAKKYVTQGLKTFPRTTQGIKNIIVNNGLYRPSQR